jgi:hypothetical protein
MIAETNGADGQIPTLEAYVRSLKEACLTART